MALFGTDGARGVANRELTVEMALTIGKAAGARWGPEARVLVARDTRISSGMLEAGVAAGLTALGVDVWMTGMLPTPALAHLIKATAADGGVMISASHNPPRYNGIKLLDDLGRKWPPEQEQAVETGMEKAARLSVEPEQIGQIRHLEDDAVVRYRRFLVQSFWDRIDPLYVVVDLAHGAAISTAVPVLEALGVKVGAIHAEPWGERINQACGATHPEALQQAVRERKADLGLAFDGDADRLIAVDQHGQIVDGDAVLYLLACGMKLRGELTNGRVVATVMSNLGLERALAKQGIPLTRTPVGDRWVAERLQETGAVLGGEQSGHIILKQWSETGDGLLTALAVMAEMQSRQRGLAELTSPLERYPQVLHNVRLKTPIDDWNRLTRLKQRVAEAERDLGAEGRVLIRPSGTEPLLRVMVEGRDSQRIQKWVKLLVQSVEEELGALGIGTPTG